MAETNSLTDQTLARLRKLADGNGLPAESIQLIETQESLYSVEGSIRLSPHFDTQSRTYTGPARTKGKNLQMLSNFAALQEEANQFKLKFDSPKIWAEEAIKELQNESGHGWGQHNALIAMPDQNITLAATEKCFTCEGRGLTPCPQCQSRSTILCPYCFGKGQENCYNCFGRMHEPNNPQIVCHICRGTRFAPCRNCQSRGTIPCPHCQGRGGVICEPCRGTGKMTQEIALTSSIEIDFQLGRGTELPSGLLRGMERLGLVNMSKGHAEITMTPPDFKDPESDKTSVRLTAKLPYADIKISLKGKGARISAFGKRALLLGVPAFLDESLKPWREHLERATTGQGSLEKALEVRVLRDAHALLLEGKKQVNDLRRLYPVGLSPQAAEEIMRNMNGALRRLTRTARLVAAAACVAASTGLFVGLFLTSFPTRLTARLKLPVALSLDALIALLAVGLSWLALTQSARWALQRETPGRKVTTKPNIGKLGYGALAAIAAIYLLLLAHARLQLF